MGAETSTSSESNHHHDHKTSSDMESDQLDWDPERIDDDGYPLVDENGSTLVPVPREGPLEEDEASSLTAWAQGVHKTMFEKKPPRRDRNIRTPFRDKARDHSTERVTGAELRKRTRCYRCRQLGHMARESQNPAPKDTPQSSAKNFFLPGDAFAQLHNLSSYMLYDGASKTVVGCNSDLKHPEFIGLILGPARGLTDTSTATCGGRLSCSAMVRSPSQAARFGARGRDTVQHDCDPWWNWHGQGCASSGFPCWNRGCERSDAILGARGAHVGRWKTTVHSTADTNHDYAPARSKHPHRRPVSSQTCA